MRTRALALLSIFALLVPGVALAQGYIPGSNFSLLPSQSLCLNSSACTATIQYNAGQTAIQFTAPNGVLSSNGYGALNGPLNQGLAFSGSNTSINAGGQGFAIFLSANNGYKFASAYQGGIYAPAFLEAKRTGLWYVSSIGDTTFTSIGTVTLGSIVGTPTSASGTADPAYNMIKYASGAVSGNTAGVAMALSVATFGFGPRFTIVFRTDSVVTSQRIFIGLANADLSGIGTLAGLNTDKVAVIRFDTGLSDVNFQCITSDGTTASATDSGIAVAANTTYTVTIDLMTAGNAYFTINGNPSLPTVTKTTNIPTGTTAIGPDAIITTLTTAARNIYLARLQLDQN